MRNYAPKPAIIAPISLLDNLISKRKADKFERDKCHRYSIHRKQLNARYLSDAYGAAPSNSMGVLAF